MGILNTLETMLNVMERSKEVHILGVNLHQQYSQFSLRQTLFRAGIRGGGRGFSLATMSMSPCCFHKKQKENRTQRTSGTI